MILDNIIVERDSSKSNTIYKILTKDKEIFKCIKDQNLLGGSTNN
jgi:hypothetical protein